MIPIIDWTLPIKLVSPNTKEHWTKPHKRNKKLSVLLSLIWQTHDHPNIELPVLIKITRFSPRLFDSDNFISSCKFLRDELCGLIRPEKARGHADGDGLIKIEYAQEKSKATSVRIQIFSIN